MMESTKFGQEGQRKYNTNGKRMNRRGKMVLGILGGYVPTDAPASNLLVAQCHWEQNVSSLTVSCLLLANCHASTTAAYNNRVMRLFLWILYKTSLCPIPQLRDFSTCIPPDAFALAQVKKIISNIGAAHKLCKNFWTSQLPKMQVSAFYFPEEMSNLILTSFVVWQEWPWLLTPAQHLHVFFFLRKMNFKSGHAQYSSNHILSSFHMFKYFPSSQTEWLFSLVTECRVGQIPGVENGQCATIAKQRMVSVGRSIAKHCSILTCDLKGAVGNQFEYQKNNDCPLFIIQNTAIYFQSSTQPWSIVKCRCQCQCRQYPAIADLLCAIAKNYGRKHQEICVIWAELYGFTRYHEFLKAKSIPKRWGPRTHPDNTWDEFEIHVIITCNWSMFYVR